MNFHYFLCMILVALVVGPLTGCGKKKQESASSKKRTEAVCKACGLPVSQCICSK